MNLFGAKKSAYTKQIQERERKIQQESQRREQKIQQETQRRERIIQQEIQERERKIQQEIQKKLDKEQKTQQEIQEKLDKEQKIQLEKEKKNQEQANLVHAIKFSIENSTNNNLNNDNWLINTSSTGINRPAGESQPTNNKKYNKCKWKYKGGNRIQNIYEPLVFDNILVNCILAFNENALRSIHYNYIERVGGHVTFTGELKHSEYNIRFGIEQNSKKFGFWNVKKTLLQLNIENINFINSQIANCMIDCWIDFNGYSPPSNIVIIN